MGFRPLVQVLLFLRIIQRYLQLPEKWSYITKTSSLWPHNSPHQDWNSVLSSRMRKWNHLGQGIFLFIYFCYFPISYSSDIYGHFLQLLEQILYLFLITNIFIMFVLDFSYFSVFIILPSIVIALLWIDALTWQQLRINYLSVIHKI